MTLNYLRVRDRGIRIAEFKARLVYRERSRIARVAKNTIFQKHRISTKIIKY